MKYAIGIDIGGTKISMVLGTVKGRILARREIRTLTGSVAVQQEVRWDGQDGDGNLVAPGVYLCRIEVEAGVGTKSQTEIVHVAY